MQNKTSFIATTKILLSSCALLKSAFTVLQAVFQLRVIHTYVHARKTLNPFQYYIWNEQLFR